MPRLFLWTLSLCLRSLQMHFVIWDAGSLEALWAEPGFYNGLYQPWLYKSKRCQRGASVTMRLICVTLSLCASCMLSAPEANVWRSSVLYHACWTHWFVDVRWHILFSVSFTGGSLVLTSLLSVENVFGSLSKWQQLKLWGEVHVSSEEKLSVFLCMFA